MDISCLVPEVQNLVSEDTIKCLRSLNRKKIHSNSVPRGELTSALQSWFVVSFKLTAEIEKREKILSKVSADIQVLRSRDLAELSMRAEALECAFYQLCHVWYGSASLNILGYSEIEIGQNFMVWLCKPQEE